MEENKKYNIIIESVGNAKPSVTKILAEGLELPIEYISQSIYQAPSPLFRDVDASLAENVKTLLTGLGLHVRIDDSIMPLPAKSEKVEVCIYVHNIENLPTICQELSEFLGCTKPEAIALLQSEPPIVLGGVSESTAIALSQRVNAEVSISFPERDLFNLHINTEDTSIQSKIESKLTALGIEFKTNSKLVEHISYSDSQKLWAQFQYNQAISILNTSYRRFEIVLESIDLANTNASKSLIELTGMPEDIVDEVLANLPIQLEESIAFPLVSSQLENYKNHGLNCSAYEIPIGDYTLEIAHLENREEVIDVLENYFEKNEIPKPHDTTWTAPKPIKKLIARFIAVQLQNLNCEVNLKLVKK